MAAARSIVGVYDLLTTELGKGDKAMGCPDVAYLIMELAGTGQCDAMLVLDVLVNDSYAISTLAKLFTSKTSTEKTKAIAKQLIEAKATAEDFGNLISNVFNKSEELEDVCISGLKRKMEDDKGNYSAMQKTAAASAHIFSCYSSPRSAYYNAKRQALCTRRRERLQIIKEEWEQRERARWQEEEDAAAEAPVGL